MKRSERVVKLSRQIVQFVLLLCIPVLVFGAERTSSNAKPASKPVQASKITLQDGRRVDAVSVQKLRNGDLRIVDFWGTTRVIPARSIKRVDAIRQAAEYTLMLRDRRTMRVVSARKTDRGQYLYITRDGKTLTFNARDIRSLTDPLGQKVVPKVLPDGSIVFVTEDEPNTGQEWADNTQVYSWTPTEGGTPGQVLKIVGQYLQGIELWLGTTKLNPVILGEPGGSQMAQKLPQGPPTGSLRVVRPSDGATYVLDNNYHITAPDIPDPDVLDFFEHAIQNYSWRNSYLLSSLSDQVYLRSGETDSQGQNRLEDDVTNWGINKVTHLSANTVMSDTQGVVMSNDAVVIVVFRGTETKPSTENATLGIADWLTDVGIVLVPPPEDWGNNVLIHSGFLAALEDIYGSAAAAVQSHLTDGNPISGGKKVWVAGHSLGGALASLFAYKLEVAGDVPVRGVVTYGSPRAGNAFWQTEYNNRFGLTAYRWLNYTDPIPHFPPATPGVLPALAYRHVGVRIYIYENGVVSVGATAASPQMEISGAFQEHAQYTTRIYNDPGVSHQARSVLPSP